MLLTSANNFRPLDATNTTAPNTAHERLHLPSGAIQ